MNKIKLEKERFEREALIHLNSVYRLAISMTNNEEEAKDITQETMLKAFRFFHTFQEGTNCKAWLFKILINTLINKKRKKKIEHSFMEELDITNSDATEIIEQSRYYNEPQDEIIKKLTHEDIMKIVEILPKDYRTAVILADIEGFSYREISEIMDCPIGTVMSRLFRGRKFVRTKIIKRFGLKREKSKDEKFDSKNERENSVTSLEKYIKEKKNKLPEREA